MARKRIRFRSFVPGPVGDAAADEIERRLSAIGMLISRTAVRKLNKGQPVRRTSGGQLVGLDPSAAGEPPRTLSGRLKQSVGWAIARTRLKIVLRVGTNVVYGRRLELGFHGTDGRGRNINQDARPWLRVSVTENRNKIKKISGGG